MESVAGAVLTMKSIPITLTLPQAALSADPTGRPSRDTGHTGTGRICRFTVKSYEKTIQFTFGQRRLEATLLRATCPCCRQTLVLPELSQEDYSGQISSFKVLHGSGTFNATDAISVAPNGINQSTGALNGMVEPTLVVNQTQGAFVANVATTVNTANNDLLIHRHPPPSWASLLEV